MSKRQTKKQKLHTEMMTLAQELFGKNMRFVGFAIGCSYDSVNTKQIEEQIVKLEREKRALRMGYVNEILDREYAITPDGEKLYSDDGNVYAIGYDYHGEEGITDLVLISEYQPRKDTYINFKAGNTYPVLMSDGTIHVFKIIDVKRDGVTIKQGDRINNVKNHAIINDWVKIRDELLKLSKGVLHDLYGNDAPDFYGHSWTKRDIIGGLTNWMFEDMAFQTKVINILRGV